MFKKPFNKVVGEQRICKHCDKEFYTFKPRYRCNECINAKQKIVEQRKRATYEKKAPYPHQAANHNYNQRFRPLRVKLHKMKERSEWQEYFKIKLDEIFNDAVLMKWIWDRRDAETKSKRVARSKNVIKKDYPDTRGHYEY